MKAEFNVGEFIEFLKQFSPDATVVIEYPEDRRPFTMIEPGEWGPKDASPGWMATVEGTLLVHK